MWSPFVNQVAGVGGILTSEYRRVFVSYAQKFLPGGRYLDGTKTRDPGNDPAVTAIRAGSFLGKITSSSLFASALIGKTLGTSSANGTTLAGNGTSLTVSAAAATELYRRQGSSGTFTLRGPEAASGTVRKKTVTYSAVNTSTGVITITATGTADVWTLTAPAGTDGGYYQLEITTGMGTAAQSTQTTASLAANANSATVDAALEALSNVGTGGVAAVYSDPTLTLTFSSNLGPVFVRVLSDTTNDGGVFEGGWAAVHTTTGVDGRFIAGSFVGSTDGSEDLKYFLPDGPAFPVDSPLYPGGVSPLPLPLMPIDGLIDVTKLADYPTDPSMKDYVRTALSSVAGGKFMFSDVL